MTNFIKTIFTLCVLTGFFCVANIALPRAAIIENPDTDTPALVSQILSYLANPKGANKLVTSNLHLAIARYYIHSGHPEKAAAHLDQVTTSDDRASLLRPYIGMILESHSTQQVPHAISLVSQSQSIFDKISKLEYLPNGTRDWPVTLRIIQNSFCYAAIRTFAENDLLEGLDSVAALTECAEERRDATRFKTAVLLKRRKYRDAYEFATVGQYEFKKGALEIVGDNPALEAFSQCLEYRPSVTIADAEKKYLQQQKDLELAATNDFNPYLLSLLLARIGDNEGAFALAQKQSGFYRENALRNVFSAFYLSGDRDNFFKAADALAKVPEPLDLRSWQHARINDLEILKKNPTSLAYEFVLQYKPDDALRFSGLYDLYNADKNIPVPGCKATPYECIERELLLYADAQTDELVRDHLYSKIITMQKEAGFKEEAKKTYNKIKDSGRQNCYYDICSKGLVFPPMPTGQACAGNPNDATKAACRYQSGEYLEDIAGDERSTPKKQSYFENLVMVLAWDKNYTGLLKAAAKLSDRGKAEDLIVLHWKDAALLGTPFGEEKEFFIEQEKKLRRQREAFLSALNDSADFSNNDALWTKLVGTIELAYWNGPYKDYEQAPQQRKITGAALWDMVRDIREKHTNIPKGTCHPLRLGSFENECEIRTALAQGNEQQALRVALDSENSETDVAQVAALILDERFLNQNASFGLSTNRGNGFPRLSMHGCPLPEKEFK